MKTSKKFAKAFSEISILIPFRIQNDFSASIQAETAKASEQR
jgi:hypothetical protein